MTPVVILALLMFVTCLFFFIRSRNKAANNNSPSADNQRPNPYIHLRNTALTVTPEQLELNLPKDTTVAFGVVMDWGMKAGSSTVVCYQTGDASIYFSGGGGIIGGGHHANVSSEAKKLVEQANTYISQASKSEATSLPGNDVVYFHILTTQGQYLLEENMAYFKNSSSPFMPLFTQANNVITELRKTTE